MSALERKYREFRALFPYMSANTAVFNARIELRAEDEGLKVTWEDETMPWDGDCPAPAVHACAFVRAPGYDGPREEYPYLDGASPEGPWVQSADPQRLRHRSTLASLGSIGLASWQDPYMRDVGVELLSEALDELDAEREREAEERDRAATEGVAELSARATYAGVAP